MRPVLPLLVLTATVVAQSTRPAVDVWQRIGSPDFAEREKATNELWRQGEAVRERLAVEAETGSVDKRDRCRRLLWLLDLGVTPGMKSDEIDAITGYSYVADQADKNARLAKLRDVASKGSPLLIRLALNEPDPDARSTAYNYSFPKATDACLSALLDASPPDVEKIAAYAQAFSHVQIDPNVRVLDAAVLSLTGRLEGEIKRLTDVKLAQGTDARRLARLQAAAGYDKNAIVKSRVAGADWSDNELSLRLRYDSPAEFAKWLATRTAEGEALTPARVLARRLAGEVDAANAELAAWRAAQETQQDYTRRRAARALMLAGDPEGAAELFAQLPEGVGVLAAMGRWVEAFSIDDPPADSPQRAAFDTAVQRLKSDAGLIPPAPRPARADRDAAPPDIKAAVDAYKQKRYADAVAACDRQLVGDAEWANVTRFLRATCLGLLKDDAADQARLLIGLRIAAKSDVWLGVIDKLDDLGLRDLAGDESERLERCAVDNSLVGTSLAMRTARRAAAAKDWAAAARSQDRILLTHLTTGSLYYPESAAYVRGPYLSNAYHARAAWDAGDKKAAIAFANTAATYFPTSGAMAIEFVPKLTAENEKATADALFDRTWARQMDLCRDYPKAARLRNTAAWTALRCDRHLDEALKLAEQSVALAPGNPASLDTLAEALFRAGRKDEAVARMREAVALMPNDSSAKQRLAGFERGEVVVPDEPD